MAFSDKDGGGCSSAGRAGRLVIGRSLVQILAPGRAELHVEVSLSKILNPKLLLVCSWHIAWRPLPSVTALWWAGDSSMVYPALTQRSAIGSSNNPHDPIKGIKRLQTMDGWIFWWRCWKADAKLHCWLYKLNNTNNILKNLTIFNAKWCWRHSHQPILCLSSN